MKKGMFIHIKHLGLALVIAMCTFTSCNDVINGLLTPLFPKRHQVDPPYIAFWEYVNNTDKDMLVEFRRPHHTGNLYDTIYSYELLAGDTLQTEYHYTYHTKEQFKEELTTANSGWGTSLECVFYDSLSGDIIYKMDYSALTNPNLWTSRCQDDPIMGDYLYSYFQGLEANLPGPEDIDDDWYKFIYWTFTLTDEHLAEYATGKNQ